MFLYGILLINSTSGSPFYWKQYKPNFGWPFCGHNTPTTSKKHDSQLSASSLSGLFFVLQANASLAVGTTNESPIKLISGSETTVAFNSHTSFPVCCCVFVRNNSISKEIHGLITEQLCNKFCEKFSSLLKENNNNPSTTTTRDFKRFKEYIGPELNKIATQQCQNIVENLSVTFKSRIDWVYGVHWPSFKSNSNDQNVKSKDSQQQQQQQHQLSQRESIPESPHAVLTSPRRAWSRWKKALSPRRLGSSSSSSVPSSPTISTTTSSSAQPSSSLPTTPRNLGKRKGRITTTTTTTTASRSLNQITSIWFESKSVSVHQTEEIQELEEFKRSLIEWAYSSINLGSDLRLETLQTAEILGGWEIICLKRETLLFFIPIPSQTANVKTILDNQIDTTIHNIKEILEFLDNH